MTILPKDLTALLDALGVRAVPSQTPPRDPAHDAAARTGISAQWRPTPGDTEPNF